MERYNKGIGKKVGYVMKTGIIFDVDGRLWNACDQIAESWNLAFDKFPQFNVHLDGKYMEQFMGIQLYDILEMIIGKTDDETMRKLGEMCSLSEMEYLLDNHPGTPYPHTVETIKMLSEKYYIGIVSNCMDGYIDAFINYNGLGEFVDAQACPGAGNNPKWENIKKLIDEDGIDTAFYVGDTMADCIAAKKAGARFIHAAYGFGKVDGEPSVNSISELPGLIDRLMAEGE